MTLPESDGLSLWLKGKACGGITEVDMEDDSDDGPAEAAQEDEASDGVAFLKTSRYAHAWWVGDTEPCVYVRC